MQGRGLRARSLMMGRWLLKEEGIWRGFCPVNPRAIHCLARQTSFVNGGTSFTMWPSEREWFSDARNVEPPL